VAATETIGNYIVRRPREQDLAEVLRVVNESEQADYGGTWLTEADIRAFWSLIDPDRDLWVVADRDGELVATAAMRLSQPVQMWAFVSIVPAHRGRSIGAELCRLAEGRAREQIAEAPEGTRVVLRQNAGPEDQRTRGFLEANGYRYVRRFWTMAIELDEEPPPPEWPPGVRVAPLGEGEERAVFEAMEEAFQDHWGNVPRPFEEWRAWMIQREGFDPTLWRLVWDGDELAAASLNAIRAGDGWVNVLGVRRPWRRRGLGLALLHESFGEFRRRGLPRALLGVDSENPTGATALYERAGMQVERSSDTFEKVLREGAELS
jgi:mycothiol synthase